MNVLRTEADLKYKYEAERFQSWALKGELRRNIVFCEKHTHEADAAPASLLSRWKLAHIVFIPPGAKREKNDR